MRSLLAPLLLEARRRALMARRRGRTPAFLALTAAAAVMQVIAIVWILGFAIALWQLGAAWLGVVYLFLVAIGLMPWTVARSIAVPLGRPRLAWHLADLSMEARADRVGVSAIVAGWALCRQRQVNLDDAAWIEARRDARGRVGDARVIATGVIAAARGDREAARTLIESAALLPELTPIARELGGEWLAADDAERGAWRRILERAPRRVHAQLVVDAGELGLPAEVTQVKRPVAPAPEAVWPATPMTYLLEGVAARLLGAPGAPGDVALFLRWLEAPRLRHTWPLVQRALAPRVAAAAPPVAEASAASPAAADPMAGAMAAHVVALDALARGALQPAQVIAAAAAWDRALASAEFRTEVLSRALDVGAPPAAGHRVLDDLARTAGDELAALILAADVPVDCCLEPLSRGRYPQSGASRLTPPRCEPGLERLAGGGVLDAAVQRVRHRLLAELEVAISRTADRARDKRALPAIDEWRELVALRAAHRRAARIGGDELRRLAFPHLHEELTPWLVWLWNDRHEHAISDALTCWLLAEALAVGDAQAIETHAKNASLPLPPRG